jgi:hypothetical protein
MRNLRFVCYPSDDIAFESAVQALFAGLADGNGTDEDLASAIVDRLRIDYPSVLIRSRDPIAEFSVEQATWYVYRDGRPTAAERTDRVT